MNPPTFASTILIWYKQNGRDLPWRSSKDPYSVWVSEIMLQQTRVETVIPYFERWMSEFPTIHHLAAATQQKVLSAWEGLGYYSRARNLHRAAKIVVEDMEGKLPGDTRALCRLPGIGRYTAGAISSIAFGLDEPTLDSNSRRVLARVFNVIEPVHLSKGKNILWKLAKENLPAGQAGEYNQALMDLGATICASRAPGCQNCPVSRFCLARESGVQAERPVTEAKRIIPHYTVTAAVIERNGYILLAQRPTTGLLGGMWEFPGGKQRPGESIIDCLKREILEELGVQIEVNNGLGEYRHAYTHFRITLHAFRCTLLNGNQPRAIQVNDLLWIKPSELLDYPMGKIDRKISREILSLEGMC